VIFAVVVMITVPVDADVAERQVVAVVRPRRRLRCRFLISSEPLESPSPAAFERDRAVGRVLKLVEPDTDVASVFAVLRDVPHGATHRQLRC